MQNSMPWRPVWEDSGAMAAADVLVVGGGIVGLATARALALEHGLAVELLEAEPRLAAHQTGHNSGVVHSGLYYRPGSVKAATCAAGREALYRYVEERGIAHERCGKVVAAVAEEELPRLDELERRGRANGLAGLERLDGAGLRAREPRAAGRAGLWVPETGIVDYGAVAEAFAADVRAAGGAIATGARVERIARGRDTVEVSAGGTRRAAPFLVACAGLESDRLARAAGLDPGARIVPFRGDYYELVPAARGLVRGLIYPVPDPDLPFLGVHFTRRVDGSVEAGPNAVLAWRREGYSRTSFSFADAATTLAYPGFWRMAPRQARVAWGEYRRAFSRRRFVASLRRLVPDLKEEDVRRAGCGVRAQALGRDGKLLDDFVWAESERMLHVINAPSPAATASLAIGRQIAARVRERLEAGA
jgi:L-2-hydroxyglutarate oxidase